MNLKLTSLILGFSCLLFFTAKSATYTVTITTGNDWWPDNTPGSYQDALRQAGLNAGPDTIVFNLPGGSQINGQLNFFAINHQVFIDGRSLVDGGLIEMMIPHNLTGSQTYVKGLEFNTIAKGATTDAINITGTLNVVDSCVFSSIGQRAIFLTGANNNTVQNCVMLGTANNHNISLLNSNGNLIDNCSISNGAQMGILFDGTSANNGVTNCDIFDNGINGIGMTNGTNTNTIEDCNIYDNQNNAIVIDGGTGHVIRRVTAYGNNIVLRMNGLLPYPDQAAIQSAGNNTLVENCFVYGNGAQGILIQNGTGSIVQNNVVGRSAINVEDGNAFNGIFVWSADNTTVTNNIVVNNGKTAPLGMFDAITGIRVQDVNSGTVSDNYVGTDANKANAGNAFDGITLYDNATNVLVSGNIIGFNGFSDPNGANGGGIALRFSCANNTFTNNWIGVHPSDTSDIGNNRYGISIEQNSSDNIVGGANVMDRNFFGGQESGLVLEGSGVTGNEAYFNAFGDVFGTDAGLGQTYGVLITSDAANNTIGAQNQINSFVGNGTGIHVRDNADNNTLRFNNFSCNSTRGITLENGGNSMYGKDATGNFGLKNVLVNTGELRTNYISGFAPPNAIVDIYVEDVTCPQTCNSDIRQGSVYITSVTASGAYNAEADGYFWEYDLTDPSNIGGSVTKDNVVVMATEPAGSNPNSSEFSICVNIPQCIPPVDVAILQDNNICVGESTILRATADSINPAQDYHYTWYRGTIDPSNLVETNLNDSTLSVAAEDTGSYFVVIASDVDSAACADNNANAYPFSVWSLPIVDLQPNNPSFCQGDSVEITTTLDIDYNYVWTPNFTSTNGGFVSTAGAFKVVVTDNNGCQDSATTTVTVNDQPIVDIDNDNPSYCAGSSVTISTIANADYGYIWSPGGSTSNSVDANTNATYRVTVTTSAGCSDSASVDVVENPLPQIEVSIGDTNICSAESESIEIFAIYDANLGTLSWSNDLSGDTSTLVTNAPQTLTVTFTDTNSCVASDAILIEEQCDPTDVRLPNVINPDGTTNNIFEPIDDFPLEARILESNIIIYNRWGRVVHKSTESVPNWDGRLNGRPVSAGTYFWVWEYKDSAGNDYKKNGYVEVMTN
jgi:gliding motility-associated-like protein